MHTSLAETTPSSIAQPGASAMRSAEPARMDLYLSIHKALRSFMSDTLVRVGRIDVADAADRDAALAQLDRLLELCLGHLRHENAFVHTAIEARQPAGSRRVAEEHVEHVDTIAELQAEVHALRSSQADDAERLAVRLYRHLALFVAENFQHMHVEETTHNALLWQHYSDRELGELHARILASISPEEHALVARWMLPASTPAERAQIVGAAKSQMPAEALSGMLATIRPHIDDAGWAKLATAAGVDPGLGRA
jgi:hypothetical protein